MQGRTYAPAAIHISDRKRDARAPMARGLPRWPSDEGRGGEVENRQKPVQ